MRIAATLLFVACSGGPTEGADAEEEIPGARVEQEPNEVAMLKAGPPGEFGPAGRALVALAEVFEVGTVRCPVDGLGRVNQKFGTPRDALRDVGPSWLLEVSDPYKKPWSPTFDVMPVEANWVTLLAEPGSTGSVLQVGKRRLSLTWPAAEKGKTVTCSGVEALKMRVVTGAAVARDVPMVAVGCSEGSEAVATDGYFVVDAYPPCTLWLEASDAHRTAKVAIEPGATKLKLEGKMEWVADTIQNPDRSWTEDGKGALRELVRKVEDDTTFTLDALETVRGQLSEDEASLKVVQRWHNEITDWQRMAALLEPGAGVVPK